MDDTVNALVRRAVDLSRERHGERVLIAISGAPGSGKSSLTERVQAGLNVVLAKESPSSRAAILPQDGYHLSRAALRQLPDPDIAFARRGAPFTFDPHALVEQVRELRDHPERTQYAPSFNHRRKDPDERAIVITPDDRIVLIEGSFVHLDIEPWRDIAALVDELWFVRVDRAELKKRIIRRHLAAGIADTYEEAEARALNNDLLNGDYILGHSLVPDLYIDSIEDCSIAAEK
ncbi:P-loop containing nucleoside triphosphate hydrolase protein [Dipodascopsis tothii]|uniref:P-loop containing nucleoside triphosphate hydrolase protein n=1 Tax=Dipodascopsis tothii TaxID=44089 RepID=UPI0034CD31B9